MATTAMRATSLPGEARSWAPAGVGDAQIRLVLGAAMLVSAGLCLRISRGTTFTIDEVAWFSRSSHLDVRGAIASYNGHLILTTKLVYAAILNAFGAGYLPFRLLVRGAVLLTAGLFFEFARRRIGAVAALAPTLVLLVYGSAGFHVLAGNGFTVLLPLAAGIAALLALEREDRGGDIAACLLLCLAIATYSVGVAFVAGAAVLILIGADRWRRAWVFLVPALLYAAWLVWSRHMGGGAEGIEGNAHLSNLLLTPNWTINSLATIVPSLLGLNYSGFGSGWGPPTVALTLAALGWRLWQGSVPRWLWAAMAVPATLWLIGAAAAGPERVPSSPRYIYPVTIGVLLVAVEAARGVRLGRRGMLVLYAVAAISLGTNIILLRDRGRELRGLATTQRTTLTAVEIGGGREGLRIIQALGGTGTKRFVDTAYMQAMRQFGSPAFSLAELRAQPEPVREVVDADLADSLDLHLRPMSGSGSHCGQIGGGSFELLPGGAVLRAEGASASLMLRRFGDAYTVEAGTLEPGVAMQLAIPHDAAPDPWYASTSTTPLLVCSRST